ncbi:hypothetical protein MSG28_009080 [Choristoneura fumiferana]|uniref:Uncharacterized protein n=1 Tax=Choristoneura fumiferana TaxID=7141 RepID=A0ACC0KVY7_CHOFU|nr:hypothetical protein MSG28_009080 [Choristoneura fumiferana]
MGSACEAAEGAGAEGAEGDKPSPESGAGAGADSLASPRAGAALAGARCALCGAPLALAEGTPKLMECLHSACEPCINAKIEEKQAGRDFCGLAFNQFGHILQSMGEASVQQQRTSYG